MAWNQVFVETPEPSRQGLILRAATGR